ncbi:MAG: hypothetical protein ACM3NZ_04035 [Betaproteobacteria bacterium]
MVAQPIRCGAAQVKRVGIRGPLEDDRLGERRGLLQRALLQQAANAF